MDTGNRTVPLGRAGKYATLTVDTSRFTDLVHDHIYDYGLRQILNDAIADKTDDDGNALTTDVLVAKANKRLDALYSGELRVRRAEAEPVDPVDAEVYRMAKSRLVDAAKQAPEYAGTKGEKDRALATINVRRATNGLEPVTWAEAVAAYEAKVPGIRKAAARIVREREHDVPEGII